MKFTIWAILVLLLIGGLCGYFLCLWAAIAVLIVLPPDLDPAIQLKEYLERKNHK